MTFTLPSEFAQTKKHALPASTSCSFVAASVRSREVAPCASSRSSPDPAPPPGHRPEWCWPFCIYSSSTHGSINIVHLYLKIIILFKIGINLRQPISLVLNVFGTFLLQSVEFFQQFQVVVIVHLYDENYSRRLYVLSTITICALRTGPIITRYTNTYRCRAADWASSHLITSSFLYSPVSSSQSADNWSMVLISEARQCKALMIMCFLSGRLGSFGALLYLHTLSLVSPICLSRS